MTTIFRILVGISIVGTIMLWIHPYWEAAWLSEDQMRLRQYDGYGAIVDGSMSFYWGYLIAWMASLLGLFFFIKPARSAFVLLVALSIILNILWGIRIYLPYELALHNALLTIDGALIALAFLSPISQKFGSQATAV